MFLLRPPHADGTRRRSRCASADIIATRSCDVRLDAREWKYVAEGGANVLFRHHPINASDATMAFFQGKLLRVKKCDAVHEVKKSKSSKTLLKKRKSSISYNAHYPHPRQVIEYATMEVLPYLVQQVEQVEDDTTRAKARKGYEQVAQLLDVDAAFLNALNAQLLALETRPAHRRQSQIDVQLQYVMLLPDVTLPPPDEDPLAFFDEESFIFSKRRDDDNADELTDQTDEELFDALAISEAHRCTELVEETQSSSDSSSSDDGRSSSSVLSDDDDTTSSTTDADADEETNLLLPVRRRRVLSGSCNIFDCCFRNICVEIKPKIGFKPRGELIPAIKQQVCRFCMHQHYKRATGKVEELSEYCPLDLFSKNPERVRTALRALQHTPQNNFKVFVRSNNDDVVNVMTGLSADALPKGVAQAKYSCARKRMGFRHSCQSIGAESDLDLEVDDRLIPDVVELLTEVLLQLEILDDLKNMQLLDHVNVDGIWHIQKLLQRVQKEQQQQDVMKTLGELIEQIRSSEHDPATILDPEYIDQPGSLARSIAFLQVAVAQVPDIDAVRGLSSWESLTVTSLEAFYRQLVQRFQVATTLKDCSLLLCLRRAVKDGKDRVSKESVDRLFAHQCGASSSPATPRKHFDHLREYEHTVTFRDMEFHCVVAIVDLDVKSHKSVEDYYALDEKIVQYFVRDACGAASRRICREDD